MTLQISDPHSRPPTDQPHVYIRTLQTLKIEVAGKPAVMRSRTTGSRQLERMLMYLVARADEPVSKDVLCEIARRRSERPLRHVISALLSVLRSWGLADALVVNFRSVTLQRHPAWGTDTDQLDWLRHETARLRSLGQAQPALEMLGNAAKLCRGAYMPEYDALPDYALTDQQDRWQEVQKQVLLDWAGTLAAQPEPRQCDLVLSAIARAVQIDCRNPATCLVAARLAQQCGNQERARSYERLGHQRPD